MKPLQARAILFLTLGWFGNDMACAIETTRFQVLLSQYLNQAQWIGLVMCLGPLAGIFVQPVMGAYADQWVASGIKRMTLLQGSALLSLASMVLFLFPLPLWMLIVAIAIFYTCFNLSIVNYRAFISETSSRPALKAYKGVISGGIALFSSLGCCLMFICCALWGQSIWPVVAGMAALCVAYGLMFAMAPRPSNATVSQAKPTVSFSRPMLWFCAIPWLGLHAGFENRLIANELQQKIFRLFVVVATIWLGLAAFRSFFVMFCMSSLHLTFAQANMPLAVLTLTTLLAAVPLGKIADRMNTYRLFSITMIIYSLVCLLGMFAVHSLASAMVMTALLGVGAAGLLVLPMTLVFQMAPPQEAGSYVGLYNLFLCVGQLYSLLATGWLVDSFHSYRIILAVAALTVGAGFWLCMRMHVSKTAELVPLTTTEPVRQHQEAS